MLSEYEKHKANAIGAIVALLILIGFAIWLPGELSARQAAAGAESPNDCGQESRP